MTMTAAPTCGSLDQGIMRRRGRRDIQSLCRTMRDNDGRIAVKLPPKQQFLLIAAGQAVGAKARRRWAYAEAAANSTP